VTAGNYLVSFNTNSLLYNFDTITGGNVGIGTTTPGEMLDVNGSIKFSGELKPNGVEGAEGQFLQRNGEGSMEWIDRSTMQGGVGFGTWGDCDMTNISGYNPVSGPDVKFYDYFGSSVSISGDYAIAGARYDSETAGNEQGSATILHYNSSTGLWEKFGDKLFNPGAQAEDHFGYSVSISGDFAIVGAKDDDTLTAGDEGSASIFGRNESSGIWELQGSKLLNPDFDYGDRFGYSVSISGDYACVGAPNDDENAESNVGSASIFKRNESTGIWELQGTKIIAPDSASGDMFGYSVSISGDYAIIGAPEDDHTAGLDQGSACIYKRNESTGAWELQGSKFYSPNPAANDLFGGSVSISADYAIIGAPSYDGGAGNNQGIAYIYKRNNSTGAWEWNGSSLYNTDADENQQFGHSVFISGYYAIVGTPYETGAGGSNQGSAILFINIGSTWQRYQKIHDPAGSMNDYFGYACAVDSSTFRFVIGSSGASGWMGLVVFGKY